MEYQKILNLLNAANTLNSRQEYGILLMINANFDVGNETVYNTEVLKFNLCDYNDAYILVRGNITIIGDQVTQAAFKNCALFIKCFTKIDGTTIDDGE